MMTAATSFASQQMDWDAPDPITAFARFKQKCQLMFSSVIKDTDDEKKGELHPTLVTRKKLGYIQQLGIHKGGRQEKAGRYFRTVRK